MIVKMKKIQVLTQTKDKESALCELQRLGVLHIEHTNPPKGKEIEELSGNISLIDTALRFITSEKSGSKFKIPPDRDKEDCLDIARHIIDLVKRIEQLKEYGKKLNAQVNSWQAWGDFDPKSILSLTEKNIFVRLYQIPKKDIKKPPEGAVVKEISKKGNMLNCVVVSKEKIEMPFKEINLPKMSLSAMQERIKEDNDKVQEIQNELESYVFFRDKLDRAKHKHIEELEYQMALKGVGGAETIAYITGYVPFDKIVDLQTCQKKFKWGIVITEPTDDDAVPTLIRNPKWISLISPLFKLIGVVPGYRELDISFLFLIFFSIFFGMIIGDAAYGAIFFIITFLIQRKIGKTIKDPSIFVLLYMLSVCAIIWGFLSGTFFGQEWLPNFVKPIVPVLRDAKTTQTFCFLLGAIHLSLAHMWRTAVKIPSISSLSHVGWISILWGAFFLARRLVLGYSLPKFGPLLFLIGSLFVILFSSPKKNILKGIGLGIGNLLSNVVNSFTDVVSYIRLYAVGLATVAVADAFNKMAMDVGFNGIIPGLITILILVLGHSLNIILGPMSILVHGVRLNVLEFCNHIDVKWSGFSYKPLRSSTTR